MTQSGVKWIILVTTHGNSRILSLQKNMEHLIYIFSTFCLYTVKHKVKSTFQLDYLVK